jgi:hypothetical protein
MVPIEQRDMTSEVIGVAVSADGPRSKRFAGLPATASGAL